MNIENIAALAVQLQTLGFESPGKALLKRVCFRPENFMLIERIEKDGQATLFHIVFEKEQNRDIYHLQYYDAILQTEGFGAATTFNGSKVGEIEAMMAAVNWKNAFDFQEKGQWAITDKTSWEKELKVEAAIDALQQLELTEAGKLVASELKLKYWVGAAYQQIYGQLTPVKNRTDVSQRFYVADGQTGISAEEAIRFLQNRWLDKKIQGKKKIIESVSSEEGTEGYASTGNGLLPKRRLNGQKGSKKQVGKN